MNLSDYRGNFGETYGLTIADSPLKGLLSRAVVVLDEKWNYKIYRTSSRNSSRA